MDSRPGEEMVGGGPELLGPQGPFIVGKFKGTFKSLIRILIFGEQEHYGKMELWRGGGANEEVGERSRDDGIRGGSRPWPAFPMSRVLCTIYC